jgi:hypothetical protein
VDEADAEGVTGGVKPRGLERAAVVDVVGHGQPEAGQEAAEAEAERGVVLVQEVAAFGDVPAEVVDVGAEQRPAQGAVRGADVGAVMEVRDDELEGSGGLDPPEGLLAETAQSGPGEALPGQVPVQGRAGERVRGDVLLADEDVDDRLGGPGGLLAPQRLGLGEDVGGDRAEGALVRAASRTQGQQPAAAIGGEPARERADGYHPRPARGIGPGLARLGLQDGEDRLPIRLERRDQAAMPERGDGQGVIVGDVRRHAPILRPAAPPGPRATAGTIE